VVSATRGFAGRASVTKVKIGGSDGIVDVEGFAERAGPSVSLHRSAFLALLK
jgi:hypothetical protein